MISLSSYLCTVILRSWLDVPSFGVPLLVFSINVGQCCFRKFVFFCKYMTIMKQLNLNPSDDWLGAVRRAGRVCGGGALKHMI